MWRKVGLLAFICAALLSSAIAAIVYQPTMQPVASDRQAHTSILRGDWLKKYQSYDDLTGQQHTARDRWRGRGWVNFKLEVSYPASVVRGSTHIVRVKPVLTSAYPEGNTQRFNEAAVLRESRRVIEAGAMQLVLHLPSATIKPDTLSSLRTEVFSKWSVNFPADGTHSGFVGVEIVDPSTVNVRLLEEPEITVSVYEPLFSRKNLLALLATVLGPLVSIPGLLAFWRSFGPKPTPKP